MIATRYDLIKNNNRFLLNEKKNTKLLNEIVKFIQN